MNKIFPVNVWSVKECGVEKWFREHSKWPVSNDEFFSLSTDIDEIFVEYILSTKNIVSDVLLVLYKLTFEYASFIHALIVVKRLHDSGFAIGCSNSDFYYKSLSEKNENIKGLFECYKSKLLPKLPSFYRRAEGRVKTPLRSLKHFGIGFNFFSSSNRSTPYIAMGLPEPELVEFAESQKRKIRFFYPFPVKPTFDKVSSNDLLTFENTATRIIKGVENIAFKHGISLEAAHIDYLFNLTMKAFNKVYINIKEIEKVLKKFRETSILLNGFGTTLVRSICVAGKIANHKIIGSNHGNSMGIFTFDAFANVDLSLVDTYLVPTKGAKKLFCKTMDSYPLSSRKQAKIFSYDSTKYRDIWEENRQKPIPSKIDKIMLIEYPMVETRSKSNLGFWYHQLDLILRLGLFLRSKGLKTILKRHPDRLPESDGLYNDFFDKLIIEPFESVYEIADAYIFTNIATTTFGFALLTNGPIIFFETFLNEVWEEVHEPLKKRCRVIPSKIEPDGSMLFDEEALAKAVRKKPEEPDTEFIRKYMLP